MAKSKNTSHHNQNKKAHRNGIPRPRKSVYKQMSLKGVDPKVNSRASTITKCALVRPKHAIR